MSKHIAHPTSMAEIEEQIWDLLRDKEYVEAAEYLRGMNVPQIARLLDRTAPALFPVAFRLLDKDDAVEVFRNMEPSLQSALIEGLQDEQVQEIFGGLQTSSQARLLDEVPAEVAQQLTSGMSADQRMAAGRVLGYPEDSVGRRAAPITVELAPQMTVEAALASIRSHEMDDSEERNLSVLPVGSTTHKVLGLVDMPTLVRATPDTLVEDLMHSTDTVSAVSDAEAASRMAVHDRLLALPVVDEAGRLVGMLHVDEAQQILAEEESEDSYRSGGAEPLGQPYLATPIMKIVRSRITWLLVLAIGATLTVQVLSVFEDTLESVLVLSLFIPLLTGTGGNTGNQAATTLTRAIALAEVRPRDVWRVVGREALVGLALGAGLGILGFTITGFIYGWNIGLVIGLTLVAICTVAASVGSVMPIIAAKFGVDPAVFSNPFISTVVDALGLIVYFTVAKLVLKI